MDREYAHPLDVPALARVALMSPSHFARRFRDTFGEPPTSTSDAAASNAPAPSCARAPPVSRSAPPAEGHPSVPVGSGKPSSGT
jgi:hypothetical protein